MVNKVFPNMTDNFTMETLFNWALSQHVCQGRFHSQTNADWPISFFSKDKPHVGWIVPKNRYYSRSPSADKATIVEALTDHDNLLVFLTSNNLDELRVKTSISPENIAVVPDQRRPCRHWPMNSISRFSFVISTSLSTTVMSLIPRCGYRVSNRSTSDQWPIENKTWPKANVICSRLVAMRFSMNSLVRISISYVYSIVHGHSSIRRRSKQNPVYRSSTISTGRSIVLAVTVINGWPMSLRLIVQDLMITMSFSSKNDEPSSMLKNSSTIETICIWTVKTLRRNTVDCCVARTPRGPFGWSIRVSIRSSRQISVSIIHERSSCYKRRSEAVLDAVVRVTISEW